MHSLNAAFALLFCAACAGGDGGTESGSTDGGGSDGGGSDGGSSDGGGSDGGGSDGGGSDGGDGGDPCGDVGCDIGVEAADASCGDGISGFTAIPDGVGALKIAHGEIEWGCCPKVDVTVVADGEARTLDASYRLYQDDCDCVCELDLSYRMTDIPAGTWTVNEAGATTTATVE